MKRILLVCIILFLFVDVTTPALKFADNSEFISIPSLSGDELNPDSMTLACLVKFTSITTNAGIIAKYGAVGTNWVLAELTRFRFLVNAAGGAKGIYSTDNVPLGVWTHIAVTWDGTNIKMYINGVEDPGSVDGVGSGAIGESNQDVWLGRYHSAPFSIDGTIAGAQIWDTALSADKISTLVPRRIIAQTNLTGYWRLDEGAMNLAPGGLDAVDLSGYENHGTEGGTPVHVDGAPILWNQGD